jgi:hypothetical protein
MVRLVALTIIAGVTVRAEAGLTLVFPADSYVHSITLARRVHVEVAHRKSCLAGKAFRVVCVDRIAILIRPPIPIEIDIELNDKVRGVWVVTIKEAYGFGWIFETLIRDVFS